MRFELGLGLGDCGWAALVLALAAYRLESQPA